MPEKRNYLLGRGEQLARNEPVAIGFGEGKDPYSFGEAKTFIAPQAALTIASLDKLPDLACPHDEVVATLTLHPKYLSKSAYPNELLQATGLRAVGSKGVVITPRKSHLGSKPAPAATAEIFVAGSRSSFHKFATSVNQWSEGSPGSSDLVKVEQIRAPTSAERIKPLHTKADEILFEIVLHAGENVRAKYILDGFKAYLQSLKIDVELDDRIDTEELTFVPVRTSRKRINDIAQFSFLRAVREMSRLRELWPSHSQGHSSRKSFTMKTPDEEAVDPTIRVAIFDGGVPDVPSLRKWVRRIDGEGVVGPVAEYLNHGCAVTSALLFGPIDSSTSIERPFARVDHYRVLDKNTEREPQHSLYPVLRRIVSVLERESYDFVGFSIGPSVPIDDDDVHPWTAKIDPLLSSGSTLAAIAAGNGGESPAAMQLNRIQPPSDCVNALSIGASDGTHDTWARAPYSSVGHGRCPGIMKPDGVAFGGTAQSPFWVMNAEAPTMTIPVMGTSFASPSALRTAIGVRARLGPVIGPLAVKALLIHNADDNGNDASEVGWGLLPSDIEEMVSCAEGYAHVVYQGELDPKKFLRATIPMPIRPIDGLVTISATICIATETDDQHPLTYTRSGLQIFFRKDRLDIPLGKTNPKSSGFFKTGVGMPELQIRRDAHQWETVRRATSRMRGRDLKNPCFDIHYNPRESGHDTLGQRLPYAMIVTVHSPKTVDLFEQIFARYRFELAELRPQLETSVRIEHS